MSLLSETLVDEWLNRQGFLTMRGIKNAGVDEVDLLGVRPSQDGKHEAWHVEVQISFNPVGYISQLCKAEQKLNNRKPGSAAVRPPDVLSESVREWVDKKFKSEKKRRLRQAVWKDLDWKYVFVHGKVRHEKELEQIKAEGVTVIEFRTVLNYLIQRRGLTGASGTDISDIIAYYGIQSPAPS